MANRKFENKKKATIKKLRKNKYYYLFVAVVLIIVILAVAIDYKFRFGIIDWSGIESSTSENESQSYGNSNVDRIGDLTIKFLDVGQGDAIFIVFPDQKTMLIDAGNNGSSVEKVLADNLYVGGKKATIDYAVLTHSDSDHVGSMDYVYENYDVLKSYRPYENYVGNHSFPAEFNKGYHNIATGAYTNYLSALLNEGTEWEFFTDNSGILQTISDSEGESAKYEVDFVMPYVTSLDSFADFNDSNDMSPIILIEFAGRKIMLTGDLEEAGEKAFVEYYQQNASKKGYIDCDVLKLGHHGSGTSSSFDFLSLIKPEHAVISCGVCHGTYMHPRKEAINNLIAVQNTLEYTSASPKSLYRTDLQGTVVLTVTPDGEISFTVETNNFDEYIFMSANEIEEYKDIIKDFKKNL